MDNPDDDDSRQKINEATANLVKVLTSRKNPTNYGSYAAEVRRNITRDQRDRLAALVASGATPMAAAKTVAGPAPEQTTVDPDPTGREAANAKIQATRDRADASTATTPADAHQGAAAARTALRQPPP